MLAVYFQKDKTARQIWTPESKFEGVRRIMVYFLKNDGTPAPPTANAPLASAPAQAAAPPVANAPTPVAAATPAAAADAKQPAADGK